jgi:hypothetical protein
MRILKFFSVFVLTAVIIFGFVLGWNWKAFTVFLDNREALTEGSEWVPYSSSLRGLSEFMGQNPQYSSVAIIVVEHPDSLILFEEHTPRIMGTTANFFILTAYAVELDRGEKQGGKMLEWNEISRYQLPSVDESVHKESFRTAQNRGWIEENSISLSNALSLLAEYNSLALADYLWWQLDSAIWDELSGFPGLEHTEMPLPFSGLFLAISPDIQETDFEGLMGRWHDSDQTEWREHVAELSYDFVNDEEARADFQQYLNRNRLGTSFMQERDAMQLFPKTTANEMAGLMKKIWQNEFYNEQVSSFIKDFMRWPKNSQNRTDVDFTDYGAIYDNRMGLMNGVNFGTSTYTGDTTVQAFFLDQLPIGFWFHASGGHMHQDFMRRLIYDPALIEQMKRVTGQ